MALSVSVSLSPGTTVPLGTVCTATLVISNPDAADALIDRILASWDNPNGYFQPVGDGHRIKVPAGGSVTREIDFKAYGWPGYQAGLIWTLLLASGEAIGSSPITLHVAT